MPNPDEPVMYIVVNQDLKMDKGKIAAQVAHSACKIISMLEQHNSLHRTHIISSKAVEWYDSWRKGSYVKLVVKAPNTALLDFTYNYERVKSSQVDIFAASTYDEGRTQIEPGSLTTVAFNPAPRNQFREELLELKLV